MNAKRKLPSFPGSKSVYISLSVLTVFEALFIIAQAIFIARAVSFLFEGRGIDSVYLDLALFLIAFLLRYLLAFSRQLVAERFAEKTGKYLRKNLLTSYFKQGQEFVQSHGTGKLVTLALEGIDQVKTYIELALPKIIRSIILPFLIVLYIFTLDKASAFIVIAAIPIIIIFMILLGLAAEKMADKQYETYRILSNHFIDSLKGIETLAFLGQSKRHEKRIASVSADYRKATNKTLRYAFLSSFALDFFTSLAIAFVAVGLGFRLIEGALPLLPALTILVLAPEYFLPIRQVGQDYHASLDGQVALGEIESLISSEDQRELKELQGKISPSQELSICLHRINLSKGSNRILKDLAIQINGQKLIGLVGPSGAGKSSFIHLLAGFLQPDYKGGYFSINGERTNSLQQKRWLEKIAYIPQHPYIFPTSLLENIRFYERDAEIERVEKVIDQIGLSSFVNQLPDGIHEKIGEGGRSLSGGQEQRIALARALLSERPILLLDEPTAHLDIETEYELKQEMLPLFKNKLVLFATHRTHWMMDMDELILLDQGRIIDYGPPKDLLKESTVFKQFMKDMELRRDYL